MSTSSRRDSLLYYGYAESPEGLVVPRSALDPSSPAPPKVSRQQRRWLERQAEKKAKP